MGLASILGLGKPDEVEQVLRLGLAAEIARLEAKDSSLGRRLIAYLAREEYPGVLAEIDAGVTNALGGSVGRETPRIYEMVDKLPPAVALRLAKVVALAFEKQSYGNWQWPLSQATPWVEAMFLHALGRSRNQWGGKTSIAAALSAEYVERMLVEDGKPADTFITTVFLTDVKAHGWAAETLKACAKVTGFEEATARHAGSIRGVFRNKAHQQRAYAFELMQGFRPAGLMPFIEEIADCATENAKQVRGLAQALVRKLGPAALEPLHKRACEGDPATRAHAIAALWDLGAAGIPGAQDLVRARREHEKVASVVEAIERLVSPASAVPSAVEFEVVAPDLPTVEKTPLTAALRPVFDQAFERINKSLTMTMERAKTDRSLPQDLKLVTAEEAGQLWDYVSGATDERPSWSRKLVHWVVNQRVMEEVRRFLRNPGIEPMHVLRAWRGMHRMSDSFTQGGIDTQLIIILDEYHRANGRPSLLELEACLGAMGLKGDAIARAYMGTPWSARLGVLWKDDMVWPYFARHMDIVRDWLRLQPGPGDYWFNRAAGFDAVAAFPQPPTELVPRLFEVALGSAKNDRPHAQRALAKLPGVEARVITALADRKAEARAVAAKWLGEMRHAPAIEPLEAALRKETNDVAIGAMMSALELLGASVDKFLDRAGLPAAAEKGLAKGVPAAIEWFPWEALPEVHWSDDGKRVDPQVLKWFMVQAVKLKTPEPQALLRRYAAAMVPAEREKAGQYILEAWIAEDTKPIARAEAEKRAAENAKWTFASMKSHPKWYENDPNLGKSEQELYLVYLPGHLRTPAGSANDAKGVLAVAAAFCGRAAPPVAARYLKEWYGTRSHQCKALVGMLAWIEHATATQLMLAVGSRFRTKGIQDEAQRQAEMLADRKGWTVNEMADRTIPSAGFDEDCELDLPFGSRRFTAKLGEQFKVELFNEEGKKIAALPEPRKDDDEAMAAASKKALSAAKKDIKSIVQMQTDRLYEALCTERTWRFEDWQLYLNRHPIVRRMVQGLVWGQFADGKPVRTFRPLDDGTLTDANDEAVELQADAVVGLVHDTNLDPAGIAQWQKHLADYEVAQPFQQLGKGSYRLPKEKEADTQLADFLGHVLEAFSLRGRATKLGYQRGQAQDGGWFYEYHKRFPTLGVEALIEFTGNGLPEENRKVALQALSFMRVSTGKEGSPSAMPLSDVPAVLLSECYNDARLIAAEGTGFDPDWEKKTNS